MAETDTVIKELLIKQKAQFDIIELYHTIKTWFDINRYSLQETEHEEKIDKGKKSISIKFQAKKTIDDYTKFEMTLNFSLSNYEIIKEENKKLLDGSLKIKISSQLKVDYEEKWEKKPIMKFLRGVSDKFFNKNRRDLYKKELEDDSYDLYNKVKSFLNLHKFR